MTVEIPLRERKKALTRQAILDAADALFSQRGFDSVTVAEIADAANVSVKTLFVYFRSKEDLAFDDGEWVDDLVAALASRPEGTTTAMAVANFLIDRVRAHPTGVVSLLDWQRAYGESSALQNGLLRRWAHFEDRITEELAREHRRPVTAATRLHAIHLVGMIRVATSSELQAEIDPNKPNGITMFARWIRKVARAMED